MSDPGITPPAPPTPAPAPWFDTFKTANPEFVGDIQNRGYADKDAATVASEYHKAHREATQMISRLTGTPDKDRILIQPKPDAPEAEKLAFWAKLGRPEAADKYDFSGVKFADGSELDDTFVATLREAAFKSNLNPEQAANVATALRDFMQKATDAEGVESAAKLAADRAEVAKNWGPNKEANEFIVKQAAVKLGLTAEQADAMQSVAGYKALMEGMLKIGIAFGEDKFVQNRAPGMQGVMTREQAASTLKELRAETGPSSFGAMLAKGDKQALDKFNALTAMMVGQDGS